MTGFIRMLVSAVMAAVFAFAPISVGAAGTHSDAHSHDIHADAFESRGEAHADSAAIEYTHSRHVIVHLEHIHDAGSPCGPEGCDEPGHIHHHHILVHAGCSMCVIAAEDVPMPRIDPGTQSFAIAIADVISGEIVTPLLRPPILV